MDSTLSPGLRCCSLRRQQLPRTYLHARQRLPSNLSKQVNLTNLQTPRAEQLAQLRQEATAPCQPALRNPRTSNQGWLAGLSSTNKLQGKKQRKRWRGNLWIKGVETPPVPLPSHQSQVNSPSHLKLPQGGSQEPQHEGGMPPERDHSGSGVSQPGPGHPPARCWHHRKRLPTLSPEALGLLHHKKPSVLPVSLPRLHSPARGLTLLSGWSTNLACTRQSDIA